VRTPRITLLAAAAGTALAMAAVALSAAAPATAAASWHSIPLEVPQNEDTFSAHAISDTGVVVGYIGTEPWVWDAITGKGRALPLPAGASSGAARAVNRDGVIVGSVGDGSRTHAARWNKNGSVDVLTAANASDSGATAISDDGRIAGWSGGAFGPKSPVRFADGAAVAVPGDPSGTGMVTGIANGGTVIGYLRTYMCNCPEHGFEEGIHGKMMLSPAPDGISMPEAIQSDGLRIAGTVNYQAVTWRIGLSPATHQPFWKRTTVGHLEPNAATYANGMSRDGVYLAGSAEVSGVNRAWVHEGGGFTTLPGTNAAAADVNGSGTVLGTIADKPVVWHRT
jgi:uncharacterized membrane protein